MGVKSNVRELREVSDNMGIETVVLDEQESKRYIENVIKIHTPIKTNGHLAIGKEALSIPLEANEFLYSKRLKNEPAYLFFDQDGNDRNTVIVVKNAKQVGDLMGNSYGMEYFMSNEKTEFLIAVNWYVIEAVGSATEFLKSLKESV